MSKSKSKKNKRTVYDKKTNKPRYHIDNAGHQLPNKKIEQILLDLEMHTSLNYVAKKNECSWETVRRIYEKYKDEVNEYREEKRHEFMDEIWDSAKKALLVGDKKLETTIQRSYEIDDVIDKIMDIGESQELSKKELFNLVNKLTALTEYNIRDLSTYIGTLIDKHELLTGNATERQELSGKDGGAIEFEGNPREELLSRINSISARNSEDTSD